MKKVKVTNRSNSTVVYSILEDNITRYFAPKEFKMIDTRELEKLTYQTGGQVLLKDYLLVENEETVEDIIGTQEPEYWMTENEIKEILINGSYDKFLDTLDFAPEGIIDIIKKLAVELPLADNAKLGAIKRKTGFDAAAAIRHNQESLEEEAPVETTKRRVPVVNNPTRRVLDN